jgi:hypothetical protein
MTKVTLIYSPPREVIVFDPTSEVEVKSNQPQIFFNRLNQQMPSLSGQILLRPTKSPGMGGHIITAIIRPSLAAMGHGDEIGDFLSTDIDQESNYNSTAGTISSVVVVITINGDPADATDTVEYEDVVVVTVTVTDSEDNERVWTLNRTVLGLVPEAFTEGQWSLDVDGMDVDLVIDELPAVNGPAITDIEYRVNEGTPISLSASTIGTYPIVANAEDEIQIRAINSIGSGDWSESLTISGDVENALLYLGDFLTYEDSYLTYSGS